MGAVDSARQLIPIDRRAARGEDEVSPSVLLAKFLTEMI
jgi:hypothetical protein